VKKIGEETSSEYPLHQFCQQIHRHYALKRRERALDEARRILCSKKFDTCIIDEIPATS